MRDVLPRIAAELDRGQPVALAGVVRTWRSAPRPAGAAMLVTAAGEVVGSVSGGCVEADLYERCREALRTGESEVVTYGVSDEDAFAVGLVCGGSIEVMVQRVDPVASDDLRRLCADVAGGTRVALATLVRGPGGPGGLGRRLVVRADGVEGSVGDADLDAHVVADVRGMLAGGASGVLTYGPQGQRLGDGVEVSVVSFTPPPRLIVVGAVDYAAALCRFARLLGFRVSVVDARAVFATRARFPEADEVVVAQPERWLAAQDVDERTVICVLTHDPRFDVPALVAALATPAAYVGAMGSRRTHADRIRRLREAGLPDADLDRIRAPIGLDLGARTPEETAVSIVAEIVAVLRSGTGQPLTGLGGPIHGGPIHGGPIHGGPV